MSETFSLGLHPNFLSIMDGPPTVTMFFKSGATRSKKTISPFII